MVPRRAGPAASISRPPSATGFGGELFKRYGISLGSISLADRREVSDKVSRSRTRIEGFVLAPPLRGLEGLQLRLALQAMGLKEREGSISTATGTEDQRQGRADARPLRAGRARGWARSSFAARIVRPMRPSGTRSTRATCWRCRTRRRRWARRQLVVADKSLLERGLRALSRP